jgi:hypothetical protein
MLSPRAVPALLVSIGVLALVAWTFAVGFATTSLFASGVGIR